MTVQVWSASGANAGKLRLTYKGHSAPVDSVAWSPDGQLLASASQDGTVQVWNVGTGIRVLPPLKGPGGAIDSVAWSHDGKQVASSGDNGMAQVWNVP
jgi:WD40 repeat protein